MGTLGRAVGYLPLGSLAMQLTMRLFRNSLGTVVEAFYDQLEALRFGTDGDIDPDDLNFDQVDALSAAHRRLVASGATYEHARGQGHLQGHGAVHALADPDRGRRGLDDSRIVLLPDAENVGPHAGGRRHRLRGTNRLTDRRPR